MEITTAAAAAAVVVVLLLLVQVRVLIWHLLEKDHESCHVCCFKKVT